MAEHPPQNTRASAAKAIGWIRHNLFSTPFNGALTLLVLYGLYLSAPPLVQWAFIDADWVGSDRGDCTSGGACWVFVGARLNQFLYGFYPLAQQWRVNLGLGLLVALVIPLMIKGIRLKRPLAWALVFGYPVIAFVLFYGGLFGLTVVPTHQWGGLMLTLVLAVVGIVLSLPFGILLALGRRSRMPVIRAASLTYIEIWRGVPLITVLFMASVMLPL
ncbi:MAG: ABC transporter permease subunit, partial [Anaerolineae bacterium]